MAKHKFSKIHRTIRKPKKEVSAEDLTCICFDAAIGNFRAEKVRRPMNDCYGCAFEDHECEDSTPFCGDDGNIAPCQKGDVFDSTDYGLGIGGEKILAENIIWIENDLTEGEEV